MTAERFYRKHGSVSGVLEKPKTTLPDLDVFEVKKQKPHLVYSPKPNFVYNLSLFTKRRDTQSSQFMHTRTGGYHNQTEYLPSPLKTYTSSDFQSKYFRASKKSFRD